MHASLKPQDLQHHYKHSQREVTWGGLLDNSRSVLENEKGSRDQETFEELAVTFKLPHRGEETLANHSYLVCVLILDLSDFFLDIGMICWQVTEI